MPLYQGRLLLFINFSLYNLLQSSKLFNTEVTMAGLTCTKLTLFTVAGVAIQLVGLSLFVFGFFPVKPTLPGHSGPESFRAPTCNSIRNESERDLPPHQLRSLYKELSGIPPAFDRLILMFRLLMVFQQNLFLARMVSLRAKI